MWYEYLSHNEFVKQLYNAVPQLKNVIIEEFIVSYYGRSIKVLFDMPKWIDNAPKKWELKKYNSIMVELDFWDVSNLTFTLGKTKKNDIVINNIDDKKIEIIMTGGINAEFVADGGIIQKIEGYVR